MWRVWLRRGGRIGSYFQAKWGIYCLESLFDFRNFILKKPVPGFSASKPIKSVTRSFQESQKFESRLTCSAQELTDRLTDRQANIYNVDETEFPLNTALTKIVFAEKGIKRDNHILQLWYAKMRITIWFFLSSFPREYEFSASFCSGISVVLTERVWVCVCVCLCVCVCVCKWWGTVTISIVRQQIRSVWPLSSHFL